MKKLIFIFFTLYTSHETYSQYEKIIVDTLSEQKFVELMSILKTNSKEKIKDTIILKYDFNNESCWNLLDERSKKYIHKVMSGMHTSIEKQRKERFGISILRYREKGNKINKLIRWDSTIVIDSSEKLYHLLLSQRSPCGNSIIILPGRKIIISHFDPHFESLRYSKEKIEAILTKKE